MKQLKQRLNPNSPRPVRRRQNKAGMRLRTGVQAGVGSMTYGDVLYD